jgi:vanillate O-demethylase ferredoxin subunit
MSAAGADFFEVVIAQARAEAAGIKVLNLQSLDGAPLAGWEPGAHIDVRTRDRLGNSVVRQYSLCGAQGAATWRIAVLADARGRGGSEHLYAEARAGTRLGVRGPRNHFQLPADERPVVLVAGGIGITPLLAMADSLHAQGRTFRLHYFARSRANMAFLEQLQASPYRSRVHLSFDDEEPTPVDGLFTSEDANAWVYTCGPDGFMKAVIAVAQAAGISEMRIRKELFSSDPEVAAAEEAGGNRAFRIQLRSSGRVIDVPADKTAVNALADAGIEIVVSCEQGHCGSCLTPVLEGMPDHRDQFMLPEEHQRNDCFTPCCSRALSETLVIDL